MNNIWNAGDFGRIAPSAIVVGELICDRVPVYAGDKVLDVGCGTGNAAMSAARRRAQAQGVDPVPALLAQARRRAEFEGLEMEFKEGAASALPYPDSTFDVVLSTFGMIFSDEPEASVSEAARVLKDDGKLALTSWAAGGLNDLLFAACVDARPGLESVGIARQWGVESYVLDRLKHHFADIVIEKRTFYHRALSLEQWLAGMKNFLAPVFLAYQDMDEAQSKAMDAKLLHLGARMNTNPEHGFFTTVPYLEIHCRKSLSALKS